MYIEVLCTSHGIRGQLSVDIAGKADYQTQQHCLHGSQGNFYIKYNASLWHLTPYKILMKEIWDIYSSFIISILSCKCYWCMMLMIHVNGSNKYYDYNIYIYTVS